MDITGRPVEPNALVVLWLDRCARSLIEPKVQVPIVNHAADEATVLPHRSVHGKTETLHPEAQTLLEIRAWDDRHTRHHVHRRLLSAFHVLRVSTLGDKEKSGRLGPGACLESLQEFRFQSSRARTEDRVGQIQGSVTSSPVNDHFYQTAAPVLRR